MIDWLICFHSCKLLTMRVWPNISFSHIYDKKKINTKCVVFIIFKVCSNETRWAAVCGGILWPVCVEQHVFCTTRHRRYASRSLNSVKMRKSRQVHTFALDWNCLRHKITCWRHPSCSPGTLPICIYFLIFYASFFHRGHKIILKMFHAIISHWLCAVMISQIFQNLQFSHMQVGAVFQG